MNAESRLLLTFYGDDFTGSTDVLEALSVSGVPTVLFLHPPCVVDLEHFPECRAVGVAGLSRSQSPDWMDRSLPVVFESLRELAAPLCHYKVCSTFDSSPTQGNIGRAVELGRRVFETGCVPMIVGAPILRRYVLFGNLFATVAGETYRIDRHPTMSKHPVTPMHEGDLRLHFSAQSELRTSLVDILALEAGRGLESLQQYEREGSQVAFFDTLGAQSLREAGRALWELRGRKPSFVAGSSGVEYALLAWWESEGLLPAKPAIADPPPVDRLLVVSGSCSPVTAGQIDWALQNGFTGIAVNPLALVSGEAEYTRVLTAARKVLADSGSPIIYSAAGPADVILDSGKDDFGGLLGSRLGAIAGALVRSCCVHRTLIAGGDTSGHAGQALRIRALTLVRPFAPGSPLCRIWSSDVAVDGGEILLKGGQVGGKSLFQEVKQGRPG
ncbi:MAG: four-carbon acid sugar kinase family protein [Bryobacteraceae bacterium]|nr:four-carbon acid sugar kinase family protein [Bryobacteraceae bacterium]